MKHTKIGKVRFRYNDNDKLVEVLGPGERKSSFKYNERGQIKAVKSNDEEQIYEYNRLGFLRSIEDSTGATFLKNDPYGRLMSMTYPRGEKIEYQYDESGRLKLVVLKKKHFLVCERDLLGNIVTLKTPAGDFAMQYDYNKRFIQRKYPNGAFSQFIYNEIGRPVSIVHAAHDNSVVMKFEYLYDERGLLREAEEWSRNGELDITYSYDAYGQLKRAEYSDGRIYSYNYDNFGNLQEMSGPLHQTKASHDTHDRLESFNGKTVSHDEAGNVIEFNGRNFTYNSNDALTNDGKYCYRYNAMGLRVEVSGTEGSTRFLHLIDDLPYVFVEKGKSIKRYLWSDGQVLGQIEGKSNVLFFLEDHLGSVRCAIDMAGNIIGYSEFSPFGVPIKRIPGIRFGFSGEEQDEEGTVYLRARYYEPKVCRFFSKDPVLPQLTDEAKQNRYAYVANSPLNYVDRDGNRRDDLNNEKIFAIHKNKTKIPFWENSKDPFVSYDPYDPANESDYLLIGHVLRSATHSIFEPKTHWTEQEKKGRKSYIINTYNNYIDNYLTENYPNHKNVPWAIKKARKEAFKKFVTEHEGNPAAILSPKSWFSGSGKKFNEIPNLVIETNLGNVNFDWLTSIGYGTKVLGEDKGYAFYSYYKWKPRWSLYKLIVWGDAGEIGPPQDLNAMHAIELLSSGEISMSHILLPKHKSALANHILEKSQRGQLFEEMFLPEQKRDIEYGGEKVTGSSGGGPGSPVSKIDKRLHQNKALTDKIMSQIKTHSQIHSEYDISSGPGRVAGPGGYASAESYAALDALRNSRNSNTPNVGGVYLDKAAEVIGDLHGISGVTFDPVSNRVILIGNDAGEVHLPPVRLDDIAAAFRTVYGNYSKEPGVTIDPDPVNPRADLMNVKFFGGMENSHFGHILFEADRIMKGLSLGEDNITHEKLSVSVPDYYNMVDLGFSNLGGTHNKELWSRFWLVPERVIVKVSDDGKTITFPDTRIRVKTETMKWKEGKLVPAEGEINEKAEYFAGHFSKYYDDYAQDLPIYKELKNLANLVGFAKWMKESGVPVDLSWLEKYDKTIETKTTTPSHTVSDTRHASNSQSKTISIFGGTDLDVKNVYLSEKNDENDKEKDGGTEDKEKQVRVALKDLRIQYANKLPPVEFGLKALESVSSKPGLASSEFVDSKNIKRKVVALPTSQTRSSGATILKENELGLITRKYCSFHNNAGPFGYSWVFDLPRLRIGQPYRDKKKYVSLDNRKVMIRTFHLTRPFGLQDVKFVKNSIDQQYARTAFLPDKRADIRALYPDDKKGEYLVEYEDGMSEIFNNKGLLVRREFANSDYTKYSYGKADRLETVELLQDGVKTSEVKFEYNKQGLISKANTSTGLIRYSYDSKGDLIKVVAEETANTIEYDYDGRHLVTEVRKNDDIITSLSYDSYGRIVSEESTGTDALKTEYKQDGLDTVVVQSMNHHQITQKYDAGGRLLEAIYPSGINITREYNGLGSLKSSEHTNKFGDKYKTEYSSDNRYVKYTDPEGNSHAILYDEFGRLIQLQNERNLLINKEYGRTDEGFLENTETPEANIQVIFNKDMKPTIRIITAKKPQIGQHIVQYQYNEEGQLRYQNTKGLVDETREYKNGRLINHTSGGNSITYAYDKRGKLNKIQSGKGSSEFFYDEDGLIKKASLRHKGLHRDYEFNEGLLTKRTTGVGLVDEFQYDETGMLKSIKRNDGEHLEIQSIKNTTKIMRNDDVLMEYVIDENGRLKEMLY
ncbi:MAG: hypothetical protein GY797_29555 [Deltaproteobacteria bacterium]|nr:hypothetical protein [Deltaproteobacteria bacterium]